MPEHHHWHACLDRNPERQRVFFPPGCGIDVEDRQRLMRIDRDATMSGKMLDGVQDAGPFHSREIRRNVSRDDCRVIAEGSSGHETIRGECHIRDRSEVDVKPVGGQLFGSGPRLRGNLGRGKLTQRRGVGGRVIGDATNDAALLVECDERRQLRVRGVDRRDEG